MTTATDQELLDRLRDVFADACAREVAREGAPRPSAELFAWMEQGAAPHGADDLAAARARRSTRPRSRRVAVLVAATVGLVTCSLAAAGALPGPLQRGVADLARRVGIDLPAPGDTPAHARDPEPAPVDPTEPVGTLAPPSTLAPAPTLPGPLPPVSTVTVPPAPLPTLPTLPTLADPLSPAPSTAPTGGTLLPLPLPPLPDPFTLLP